MIVNLKATSAGSIRREQLNGRAHIVAPVRMIVEGVLNGSSGAIFYPKEVFSANSDQWNGMPLTLYHPMAKGMPVSARSATVLNSYGLGIVLAAKGGDSLDAEAWYDEALLQIADSQLTDNAKILPRLEKGEPVELSTGVFVEREKAPEGATHNGTAYEHIATKLTPDHLAILPDQRGACSLAMGCGVLMANAEAAKVQSPVSNEMTHSDLHNLLNSALSEKFPSQDVWVSDVYDYSFIFRQDGKYFRLGYSRTESGVVLSTDTPIEVVREVSFVPVSNSNGETEMKLTPEQKTALIASLVTHSCGCFKKGDEALLATMSDERLTELGAKAQQHQTQNSQQGGTQQQTQNSQPQRPANLQEWLAQQPVEVQRMISNAAAIETRERQAIINRMTSHLTGDLLTNAQQSLANRTLDDLAAIEALIPKRAPQQNFGMPVGNGFMGSVGTGFFQKQQQPTDNQQPTRLMLETPVMNWAEDVK